MGETGVRQMAAARADHLPFDQMAVLAHLSG